MRGAIFLLWFFGFWPAMLGTYALCRVVGIGFDPIATLLVVVGLLVGWIAGTTQTFRVYRHQYGVPPLN